MSTYIVEDSHITALACFAVRNHCGDSGNSPEPMRAIQRLADLMLQANQESYEVRYPKHRKTDPKTLRVDLCPRAMAKRFTPVEIIKAAQCFDYQCDESTDWLGSYVERIVDAVTTAACRQLPGYDSAAWGIDVSSKVA